MVVIFGLLLLVFVPGIFGTSVFHLKILLTIQMLDTEKEKS